MMPDTMRIDWRRQRGAQTRAVLVAACRGYMAAGNFRPTMSACCEAAERSLRSGFQHFPSIEALHLAALQDEATRRAVLERVGALGVETGVETGVDPGAETGALLQAIVTGRG